jgi:predicted RNA-binding Zn ribbon-like protein
MFTLADATVTAKLRAGHLCLEFANTAEWHASDQPQESLTSYPELVSWSQGVGILSDQKARLLLQAATRDPLQAIETLEHAIALREAIYHIFSAAARSLRPDSADLDVLNHALAQAMAQARLIPANDSFGWGWADEDALDQMLWPVVWSAASLLTAQELHRVGECADERGCGWLFLDMSRNRSRRWCDMKDCGNRAKARRFYHRRRAVKTDPPSTKYSERLEESL